MNVLPHHLGDSWFTMYRCQFDLSSLRRLALCLGGVIRRNCSAISSRNYSAVNLVLLVIRLCVVGSRFSSADRMCVSGCRQIL